MTVPHVSVYRVHVAKLVRGGPVGARAGERKVEVEGDAENWKDD
jgi:hypothetical protein